MIIVGEIKYRGAYTRTCTFTYIYDAYGLRAPSIQDICIRVYQYIHTLYNYTLFNEKKNGKMKLTGASGSGRVTQIDINVGIPTSP